MRFLKEDYDKTINVGGTTLNYYSSDNGVYYYGKIDNDSSMSYFPDTWAGKKLSNPYTIRTIHPYDEAEYHWAHSEDGKNWNIFYRGKLVNNITTSSSLEVVKFLRKLDAQKDIKADIDKS